jgi:tripartite-type tricarboxylate transporter receptor subunit TctC
MMNKLQRVSRVSVAWVFALLSFMPLPQAALAQVQNYPNKPIYFIAPIPPGGSTERLLRDVAQQLQKRLGQPVIVENKPGGAGSIGTAFVAKSAPDGYTFVLVNSSHSINPHVYSSLPFDAIKDLAPVVLMTSLPMGLFVHPSVPAKNLSEFIALAKEKPNTLNFSSSGNGGAGHLTGEMIQSAAGIKMTHIPYRGSAPALMDALAGQVQAVVADAPVAQQHVKTGTLRGLAVTSKNRVAAMPDVPTFAEAGLSGMESSIWIGILAPAKTPSDIVRKVNQEIVSILRAPAMTTRLNEQGFEVVASTPEEFGKVIRDDYDRFGTIVRNAKIKVD